MVNLPPDPEAASGQPKQMAYRAPSLVVKRTQSGPIFCLVCLPSSLILTIEPSPNWRHGRLPYIASPLTSSHLPICRRVKALLPETVVILGGPEFLGPNRKFLEREPAVDFLVRGEGEAVLPELMDRLLAGTAVDGIPGVSFRLDEHGVMHPNLTHLKRVVAVTTYGRDRLGSWWLGDPPRKMVTRYLRWFVARDAEVRYLALYGIHRALERRHDAFVARIRGALAG